MPEAVPVRAAIPVSARIPVPEPLPVLAAAPVSAAVPVWEMPAVPACLPVLEPVPVSAPIPVPELRPVSDQTLVSVRQLALPPAVIYKIRVNRPSRITENLILIETNPFTVIAADQLAVTAVQVTAIDRIIIFFVRIINTLVGDMKTMIIGNSV